jgi:hypothetical protein
VITSNDHEHLYFTQVHDVEFCPGGIDQIVNETLPALQEVASTSSAPNASHFLLLPFTPIL